MEGTEEIIFYSLLLLAVFGLTLYLLSDVGTLTEDLRQERGKTGDTPLSELYINISPGTFLFLRIALGVIGFLFGFLVLHPIFGAVLFFAGFFAPALLLKRLRAERVRKVEEQLVSGLELLGNSLKSGLTLPQSIELLVKEFPPPISQEFSLVLSETRLGVEFTDALANMATRLNSTIISILATGVAVTKKCGGDITEIFQNIATTIREQATIEGKLEAVTAQGRFQGFILSLMPFGLIGILWFVDRAHVETLFGYQLGMYAVGLVIIMVGLAQLWINRLLAIDV